MDEFRSIVASNLIRLRTASGMTQAELGTKINYSDKSISKWERAEAIPDAFVLKQLSEIYGVTVDYLLNPHDEVQLNSKPSVPRERSYSTNAITLVSIASIWTMAVFAFAILWIFGHIIWQIFAVAVPLSLIVYLVFHSIWMGGRWNLYIISALVLSIILVMYLLFIRYNPWQLFLFVIPAEIVVFFSFRIKKKKVKTTEDHETV